LSRLYFGRFAVVHIGGPSSNQAASLESQQIQQIQLLFGRTLRIVLGAAAYIFAGVFIAYFALGALFRLIRIKERRDRTHVYAREEPIPIRIFWRVSPM
jgi:hypothetical protein